MIWAITSVIISGWPTNATFWLATQPFLCVMSKEIQCRLVFSLEQWFVRTWRWPSVRSRLFIYCLAYSGIKCVVIGLMWNKLTTCQFFRIIIAPRHPIDVHGISPACANMFDNTNNLRFETDELKRSSPCDLVSLRCFCPTNGSSYKQTGVGDWLI